MMQQKGSELHVDLPSIDVSAHLWLLLYLKNYDHKMVRNSNISYIPMAPDVFLKPTGKEGKIFDTLLLH